MSTITQKGNTKSNYGKIGWGLIIFCGLCFMLSGSFWNSIAPNILVPHVTTLLGLESTASVLYANTIVALISIAVSFLMGNLHQRFSNRVMVLIEFLIMACGLILVGHVTSVPMYICVWVMVFSMAYSISSLGLSTAFGNYMPTKKASALGWATAFASVANIILLPALNILCAAKGLAGMGLIFGIIEIALGLLFFALWPDDPRKKGYQPDNGDISAEELAIYDTAKKNKLANWSTPEILKNKNFWLISICYGCFFMIQQGIGSQMVLFEVSNGIPQPVAVTIVSVVGIIGVAGSIVSGYIDQKIGTKKSAMVMCICYALSCLCAGFLPFNNVTNVLFIAFYCCNVGALSNVPVSHAISLYGTDFPKAWKMCIVIIQVISAFSQTLLGKAVSATGSYAGAFKVLTFIAIIALVVICFADSKLIKKPGEKPIVVKISNKKED